MLYTGYCCDNCETAVEYRRKSNEWLPSKTYIVKWARKNGWSIGKKVLCPDCRKGSKKR